MLLKGKKIVYVEDDARNRILVDMILRSEGASVAYEQWGHPATALSTIVSHLPVDLILLDLMFPNGFNGYHIYEEIRAHDLFNNIPVAMVSAADPAVEMNNARRVGLNGYIPKPIEADIFADQIKAIIEGERVWHVHRERNQS